jgi:hypothetical protein
MRTRTLGRFGASWLVMVAACTGGQTGDEGPNGGRDASEPSDAGTDDFLDAIRRNFGNYDAAKNIYDLADRSERIAVGTIAAVHEGRPLVMSRSGESTAVLELAATEILKGEPAERFYIELYRGYLFDAPTLPDPLPENRLLVYLIPASPDDGDAGVSASAPGLPEGAVLHTLTTPQGMVVEDDSGSVDAIDSIFQPGPFDALVDTVRADAAR